MTLDVLAGPETLRSSLRSELSLQPGRTVHLHLPVVSARDLTVIVSGPGIPETRQEVRFALSESPLLGAALTGESMPQLEGFHTVRLDAAALPGQSLGYEAIDALVVDARTLATLESAQLDALRGHLAQCGRVVVVGAEEPVRRALDAAAGCGGHALFHAASLAEAQTPLRASLEAGVATPLAPAEAGEFDRSGRQIWQRILVIVSLYFALYVVLIATGGLFAPVPGLPLIIPALAVLALGLGLRGMAAPPQVLIWSEGEADSQVARYQAWEWIAGAARGRQRVVLPVQLAAARPCRANSAIELEFDAAKGRVRAAEFETRLFRQVALCFSGSFPASRSPRAGGKGDIAVQVRNDGARAWPAGRLFADQQVFDLPMLAPGASVSLPAGSARPSVDPLERMAASRLAPGQRAALWRLDLAPGLGLPPESDGWLMVSAGAP